MPRQTDWIDTVVNLSAASGAQASVSLITGAAPINMRGVTLIRTIISIGLTSASIAGAYGVQVCDMAIGIASQEVFAAGVFPDPVTSTDKPPRGWVWRTRRVVTQNGIGSVVTHDIMADIRGARKIENGELYLLYNNSPVAGTPFSVDASMLVRVLMKLP